MNESLKIRHCIKSNGDKVLQVYACGDSSTPHWIDVPDYFEDPELCTICGAELKEEEGRLFGQEDHFGTDSLTDQQQAFLEGAQPGLCPDCME